MAKQSELAFEKETNKPKEKDEFAESCRPLAELLDSVRDIEGFPIGKDEDILALSDPPYYTACPNPYINDFIARYGKPYDAKKDKYNKKPFIGDVKEGKTDPLYLSHTYHSKIPHGAIRTYIKHYTDYNDLVLDPFCGTGFTGLAAQLEKRKVVLADLSPMATFLAYNFNAFCNHVEFEKWAMRIIDEVEMEFSWIYRTKHSNGKDASIYYTLWSDVFVCPYCNGDLVFWNIGVDQNNLSYCNTMNCRNCEAVLQKSELARKRYKEGKAIQSPVMINYAYNGKKYKKYVDENDLKLINEVHDFISPFSYPTNELFDGSKTNEPHRSHGIQTVDEMFTDRNLLAISALWDKIEKETDIRLKNLGKFLITSFMVKTGSLCHNVGLKNGKINLAGQIPNTYAIPPIFAERNIFDLARNKLRDIVHAYTTVENEVAISSACISTQSSTKLDSISDNSIDYIFTDPPFGGAVQYVELNFIWECWLRTIADNSEEIIVDKYQNKGKEEFQHLITQAFIECYRVLKPNRWITIVFHNTSAAIWNIIQNSLQRSGFVIAQVALLDRGAGSYNQMTAAGAVKNDLVINAYKPKKEFEENFLRLVGEGLEKEFVQEHLDHLPVEINIERTEQMLYSKTLAHYIQRGYEIRMNARQFYAMLRDNFKLIDGYWFNDDQVLFYEEWKRAQGLDKIREIRSGEQILFVTDEKSLLVWLYQFMETPQTFGDIFTASRKITAGIEDEIPEIKELLDQNFIMENGAYRRPRTREEQEKIDAQRERDLTRSFDQILNLARTGTKKIKGVRKEAIVLGFTQAYQEKRYQDIIDVAKRLDSKIIENDSQINDFVEFARFKTGEDL